MLAFIIGVFVSLETFSSLGFHDIPHSPASPPHFSGHFSVLILLCVALRC